MKEKITIKNFGGLDEVTIPLNSINIFIGKQASGKSVSAKLIYFFKNFFTKIFEGIEQEKSKPEIINSLINKFEDYFPSDSWGETTFEIIYYFGLDSISLKREKKINLILSEKVNSIFSKARRIVKKHKEREARAEKLYPTYKMYEEYYDYLNKEFGICASNNQIFIPAGRSFFANIQSSIYSLLAGNKTIDPFLFEFGSYYERIKSYLERGLRSEDTKQLEAYIDKLTFAILNGEYKRIKDKSYIVHKDKRMVNVLFSSSGQQEFLPLSIILKSQTFLRHISGGTTVYIEEPEAHLFPSAQKRIVELISAVYNNSRSRIQFVITTHSPYILSAFNNLLQAGHLRKEGKNEKEIEKIVSKYSIIKPNELNAFEMRDGKLINLIDEEFGMITADTLDKASEDIAKEFDALLELE